MRQKHPDKRIEVGFQDESRFGQQGSLTHVWDQRGSRPRRPRQTEYKWVYLFGAVCPTSGSAVGYLMPTVDTFCRNMHRAEISRSLPDEVHVALVLEGAGWHASKGLRVPDHVTLLPLPPYSPERNVMEPGWLYLKSHDPANRVYADHDALFAAGCDAGNRFTQDRNRVRSVCRAQWTESASLN